MDVNLTHVVVANVTLAQPLMGVSYTLIAFSGGAVVALINIVANYLIAKKTKQEEECQEMRNKRQEAYSLLLGRKYKMLQFLDTYHSIFINSRSLLYHADRQAFRRTEDNAKEIELKKEGLRTRQRSEELQIELASSIEEFFEIIGKTKILFTSQQVPALIKQIEESLEKFWVFGGDIDQTYKTFKTELRKKEPNITDLDLKVCEWEEDIFKKLKLMIDNDLDPKIIELLKHLEDEIIKEQQEKEGQKRIG